MPFFSPLRYPGGKRKLANYIKLVFQYNSLLDGHYVEPYAGGAAVALSLLYSEYAAHIHINDISRPIFAFWHSVLNETDDLCLLIQETEVSMDEWEKQKSIQDQGEQVSLLELGFSTFFLNRTNRSGILRGGVIGGKEQAGTYKIGARFNKANLIQRIRRVARYRSRISLYNYDAKVFINTTGTKFPGNTLVYLDPPYYNKGKGLYEDFYEHNDHLQISKMIADIKHRWIVSYDQTQEIRDMYSDYLHVTYNISYSTADRYKGTEIMFFSEYLVVPPIKNPANISDRIFAHILQTELL